MAVQGGLVPDRDTPRREEHDSRRRKGSIEAGRSAWENRNWNVFDAAHAESVVVYSPMTPEPTKGREAHLTAVRGMAEAFPDAKVEETGIFGSGDWICAEQVMTGTHTGLLTGSGGQEVPATNRPIRLNMLTVGKVVNSGIAEEHVYFDNLGLLAQLGILPEE